MTISRPWASRFDVQLVVGKRLVSVPDPIGSALSTVKQAFALLKISLNSTSKPTFALLSSPFTVSFAGRIVV
jgi:hypothetical protein